MHSSCSFLFYSTYKSSFLLFGFICSISFNFSSSISRSFLFSRRCLNSQSNYYDLYCTHYFFNLPKTFSFSLFSPRTVCNLVIRFSNFSCTSKSILAHCIENKLAWIRDSSCVFNLIVSSLRACFSTSSSCICVCLRLRFIFSISASLLINCSR